MSHRLSSLLTIRKNLQERLEKLIEKKALFGYSSKPELEMEIDDIKRLIKDVEAEITSLLEAPCTNCPDGFYEAIGQPRIIYERYRIIFERKKIIQLFHCDTCGLPMEVFTYVGSKEYQKNNLKVQMKEGKSGKTILLAGSAAIAAYIISKNEVDIIDYFNHVLSTQDGDIVHLSEGHEHHID